jgi:hypothetical protein
LFRLTAVPNKEEIAHVSALPKHPKKSPKEKRKKKKKISAARESERRFVIRLKTSGSAQTAEAVEVEGRPRTTTEILTTVASLEKKVTVRHVQSTDEVWPPAEGDEPVLEIVGALTLGAYEAVGPIALGQAEIGWTAERMVVKLNNSPPVDGNQVNTIPVRPPLSPASTATIVVTASGVQSRTQMSNPVIYWSCSHCPLLDGPYL